MTGIEGRGRQRGQVVLIFAFAAVFLVGAVALALDYGLASTHQRFVQDSADVAALAGANRLGPSPTAADFTDARTTAFIYLRDNLQLTGLTTSQLSGSNCDLTVRLDRCVLPNPYSQYTVSISSPARTSSGQAIPSPGQTVSVQVSESVTAALGAVLGQGTISTSVSGVAESLRPVFSSYALYVDGCLNIGNHLELVGGDVYVNQCTLNFLSQNQASFCTYSSPGQAGSLIFGPQANAPGVALVPNQTLAACRAGTGDTITSLGSILTSATTILPPAFAPPPQLPICAGGVCAAAAVDTPCANGTVDSSGAARSCYHPGAYTTIGPISNNLNPGVYVITGPNGCADPCPSVVFGGNTINANFSDVRDQCWAAPSTPSQGNWVAPCPDGFVSNPLLPVDPGCTGSSAVALSAPAFTAAPSPVGVGNSLSSGTFYVRVTAINSLGESTSNEVSVTIPAGVAGQGGLDLAIPYQAGATGYTVYGLSLAPNQELTNPVTKPQPGTPGSISAHLANLQAGSTPYPLFNNSSCATGFHNVPRNPYENYGVTFVLSGKASVCLNSACRPDPAANERPVVMLSPYCSTLSNNDLPPAAGKLPCPYARTGPNINDGAFSITGTSQGAIQVAGAGTELNLTGTLSAPSMALRVEGGSAGYARFHVIPGQVIVKSADIYSANSLDPIVYYGATGAALPGYLRLIQ